MLLVLFVATLLGTGCSSAPSKPTTSGDINAAIVYTGAWSAGAFGVTLAPKGSATLSVTRTTSLSMRAYARGQRLQVTVGIFGGTSTTITLPECSCLTVAKLIGNLSRSPHIVTVKNLSTRSMLIQSWQIEDGARFGRTGAGDFSVRGTVTPDTPLSFYVQGASLLAIDYAPTGAVLKIAVNDREDGYMLTTHPSPGSAGTPSQSAAATGASATPSPSPSSGASSTPSPSPSAAVSSPPYPGESESPSPSSTGTQGTLYRAVIAWGLPGGLEKVTISVVSGSLDLRDLVMFQAPYRGTPKFVPDDVASRAKLLAVYGDSVAEGQVSLGFLKDSDGFADRLAALRGWRLADLALRGASASCYGVANVDRVVAARPDIVIVAIGTDDMIQGPGLNACNSTVQAFGRAIGTIVSGIQEGLPGVPVYVQAIAPTPGVPDSTRRQWNAVLKQASLSHSVPFLNPSPLLRPQTDFAGFYYPNNRGAQKIAEFWNASLPS
jgi:GDSL-like Lipase/Acylhydrolase family